MCSKIINIIFVIILAVNFVACSQENGPGYNFSLFENTPVKRLADAVKNQDTNLIYHLVKSKKAEIDYREPKFGATLLHLAIRNDKYLSLKALLNLGADLTITDTTGSSAIHEATKLINSRSKSYEILDCLVSHGANVNMPQYQIIQQDTSLIYYPLIGARENYKCAKYLLSKGADPYCKIHNTYPFWQLFNYDINDESVFILKDLIIEDKMKIPNPISYSIPDNKPLDLQFYLKRYNSLNNQKKEIAIKEISEYITDMKAN